MFGYVLELLKRGVPRINLINDNDKPTDEVIQKLLVADGVDLSKIYDCRSYYSKFKDINDCVKGGQEINFEELVGC
jgi:hypothetical protein